MMKQSKLLNSELKQHKQDHDHIDGQAPTFRYRPRREPSFNRRIDTPLRKPYYNYINKYTVNLIWAGSSKKVPSNMRKIRRFRSSCSCAEYRPGLGSHSHILWCPMILLADSAGPDQTARMHRLIWVFAVRIYPKIRFCMELPICTRHAASTGRKRPDSLIKSPEYLLRSSWS